MDLQTTMENAPPLPSLPPKSHPDSTQDPNSMRNSSQLRGSGSYPTMIRARTANRNKIAKRTSDSMIITGRRHYHHGHHVTGSSSGGGGGTMVSDGNTRSAPSKKRKLLNNKKTVYSKASRRKSLENLGLLVRNRCGTAKLQWPSEKKETDVFDLLPEGCMHVRQLIRLKSRGGGGGLDGSGDHYQSGRGSSEFYRNEGGDRNKGQYKEEDASCDELEGNSNKAGQGKGSSLTSEARLQGRRSETNINNANSQTDWKNKKNISVIVRIRPKQDKERVEKSIVFRTDSKTIVFDPKEKTKDFYFQGVKQLTRNDFGRKRPNRNISFQYDKVYGPEATNKEIFEEMLKNLTDHLIEGYNSTVFAYGATGSGKTYTMIGSNSNPGLTVLMVESLYKRIDDLAEEYDCEVVCSYLEVYNETIKDLLRPEKELSIREDGKKGIIISELSFYKPRGPQELLKLLRSGNRARTQHATDLNAESSRSHAVFEVKLCLKRKRNKKCQQKEGNNRSSDDRRKYQEQDENIKNDEDEDDEDVCRRCGCSSGAGCVENECDDDDDEHDGINKVEVIQSKLVMVDLAGSERGTAASSNHHHGGGGGGVFVDGARQREGASINKSLLALASCISALADGKCHVPYRNSKLTRLLKDSLNGLCTTVMIANISPSALTSEDTYNTLKYADRAKSIVGAVAKQKNVFMEDLIVEDSAKTQMVELQVKNVQLQEQLEEEKLKRELILKELEDLQRRNVEMKSEAGQEERNVLLGRSFKMKGKRGRKKGIIGGNGDEPPHQDEVDYRVEAGDDEEECCFTGKNAAALTENQLPPQIQQYIEIAQERAKIFSEYAGFASQSRFTEWAISCKKLKADMADFLGRLPVEDENYIWFSKLKNEVNNSSGAYRNTNSAGALADAKKNDHHHKNYAVKLKNLTERLELIRQNCVENNLLSGYDHDSEEVLNSQKMVAITVEQFLEYKSLALEHEGNEKVDQFYQQFCQRINNQLITSGMTLMNALKLVKSVYLQLRQVQESAVVSEAVAAGRGKGIILPPALQQEYKELLDLVYGPGPPVSHQWQEDKEITADYNNNISSNVNNDNSTQPLSAPPQNLPQLSNLGRKSSPIMDDLASMRKLVERPLLIQLTSLLGTAEEETTIKRSAIGTEEDEGEDEDMELRSKRKLERSSNSTFSRVVTTAATTTRKTLSTSHTIYEPTQPPPVTRVRGGESSPELQLSSHPRSTCVVEQGEEEEGDDEAETRYNDDNDVEDNDHPCVIDNDDDSTSFPSNGPFQVEPSVVVTANESSGDGIVRNSLPGTTTNSTTMSVGNLANPVKRKSSSTSFEIIFDRKEEKRVGGRRESVKPGRLSRVKDKTSTPFGPSVMSALSKQKISENHFNNEEWTTATSSSGTVTTSSSSTSAENVMMMMMKENNKSGSAASIGGALGSDQQKKSIGNRKRLVDQALIKDYQHSQTKTEKTAADEMVPVVQGENDNKNGQEYDDEEGEMEGGNPSSYIYQLDSISSSIDVLEGTGGMASNKRGFGNADSSLGKRKVKSCSTTKLSNMDLEANAHASNTDDIKVRNITTTSTTLGHKPNPNPIRRRGHLKQQQEEEGKRRQWPPTAMSSKPDIGSSWRNNHQRQHHQQQRCSNTRSSNKNTGGDGGKSLNPLLSVPAGAGVITSTTPPEFSMSVQGQRKNQTQQQRLLQYKVTIPVKTSIALHPSKASTDLTARSSEKVDVYRQQKIMDHHYPPERKHHHQHKEKQQNDVMVMMVGSGDEESGWEVHSSSNSKVINMPNTKSTSKQQHGCSQHSLLSSARSTMSHQKAPYHTNCKTFTISRESLPLANMPVISSVPGNINPSKYNNLNSRIPSIETPYQDKQWDQEQKGECETNYYSSNEDEDEGEEIDGNHGDGNYTSEDDNDGATSCYSDECH